MAKNWIAGAIRHPGAMTRKAKKEGVSNRTFEQEHKGESGTAGRERGWQLRLAVSTASGTSSTYRAEDRS